MLTVERLGTLTRLMNTTTVSDRARSLERFLLDSIPPARAMQLQLLEHDAGRLLMGAPLAANVNDKGCAFGGSLTSLMTLAGWSLVELLLREHGHDCDVFVADSQVRYLKPVWEDLRAEAQFAAEADPDAFLDTLASRGKSRIQVVCRTLTSEGEAATLEARFVARLRNHEAHAAQ
ncbi:YiiD C-terminal domain-containing protein [Oleiagrimonas citrea]